MPYLVAVEGCFCFESYSFELLGDAKKATEYLSREYRDIVSHCVIGPAWREAPGPQTFGTFDEFKEWYEET